MKYNGSDKSLYPPFAGLLQAKLQIDEEVIGGEQERV